MTEVIKDLTILKKVEKETGLEFDRKFKYCNSPVEKEQENYMVLRNMRYELKYFDGCFNPFLVKRGDK